MKKNTHPAYEEKATIRCSCGAVLEVGSTKKEMQVEICSQCHPFYTGRKKMIDTTGRVDRFKKLAERASAKKDALVKAAAEKKVAEKAKAEALKKAATEKVKKTISAKKAPAKKVVKKVAKKK